MKFPGKKCFMYIPWLASFCFLSVFIGVIVWAAGASSALANTKKAVELIGLSEELSFVGKFHSVGAAAVAVCLIFVVITLGVAFGRASIEQKFEAQSQRLLGTNVWLVVQACLTAIWWAISLWLVFIVMATCLWWGSTLALKGGFEAAMSSNITYSNATATGSFINCPDTCYEPSYFEFITEEVPCICSNAVLQQAYTQVVDAQKSLVTAVAGSIIIWIGSSLVVLNMATAFAVTRKELQVSKRLKTLGDEANTVGASAQAGAFSHQFPRDTMPLLSNPRPPVPFPPVPGMVQLPNMQQPGGPPRLQINHVPMPPRMGGAPPSSRPDFTPPPQYQSAVSGPPPASS